MKEPKKKTIQELIDEIRSIYTPTPEATAFAKMVIKCMKKKKII